MGLYEVCSQGHSTGTETLDTIEADSLEEAEYKVRKGHWGPSACEDIIVRDVTDRINNICTVYSCEPYDDEMDMSDYNDLFERYEDLACNVALIRKILHGEDARDIVISIAEILGEQLT